MVTKEQVAAAAGAPVKYVNTWLPWLEGAFGWFHINTPIRQLCFLAQVGHESGGLFFTEEIASGEAYEGRDDLGNTIPGDGVRFKGRGLIQITGRANYAKLGRFLNVDLEESPALLGAKNVVFCSPNQLKYAALSAGWYWNSRNLNDLADKMDISKSIRDANNMKQFTAMTRKINGGTNGLDDRIARYRAGWVHFKPTK